jgi:hypothetical protein
MPHSDQLAMLAERSHDQLAQPGPPPARAGAGPLQLLQFVAYWVGLVAPP